MWADMFKRWMDLAFWWLPREDSHRQAEAREQAGRPGASDADRESARERMDPEHVAEPAAAAEPQRAAEPAASVETAAPEPEPVQPDDLTVIKGIGAAMQERLHTLGITTFSELAASDADDLTGRLQAMPVVISRARVEAWIEGARARL